MDTMTRQKEISIDNSLDSAMQIVFDKLSEALDDVRNGRVLSEEEFWAEYDREDFITQE